jgi:hypothetical protein
MTTTKTRDEITRDEITAERNRAPGVARARLGDRSVDDVLLRVRTRLRMLSDLCAGQVEGGDFPEMSSDGWAGLGDTLDTIIADVAILEDALPAEILNWRPSEEDGDQ